LKDHCVTGHILSAPFISTRGCFNTLNPFQLPVAVWGATVASQNSQAVTKRVVKNLQISNDCTVLDDDLNFILKLKITKQYENLSNVIHTKICTHLIDQQT